MSFGCMRSQGASFIEQRGGPERFKDNRSRTRDCTTRCARLRYAPPRLAGGTEAQRITSMEMNDVSGQIVDRALHIHRALGPGLLESVYHRILSYELRKVGLQVDTEVPIPVAWEGHVIDNSFRADLIVNQQMLVELKSVEKLDVVHSKQVLTYLKLTNLNLGLLINFGAPFLKEGIRRIVNNLKEKNLCVSTALREASTNYYESRKPFFLRAQAS